MISEAETRYLLNEWNDTAADYPSDLTAHQLIEAQVVADPAATAVVASLPGGESVALSYTELNDHRANRLAQRLRKLGVRPRYAGRDQLRARHRAARSHACRAQGRRGIRPTRPHVPRRPAGLHAGGLSRSRCS